MPDGSPRMPRMPMTGPPSEADVPAPLRDRVLKIPHVLSNPYDYSDEDLQTAIDAGKANNVDPALRRLATQRQAAWAAVEAAKKGDPALIHRAMDLMNETKRMADAYNDAPGKAPTEPPPGMPSEVARLQGLTAARPVTPLDRMAPSEVVAAKRAEARRAAAAARTEKGPVTPTVAPSRVTAAATAADDLARAEADLARAAAEIKAAEAAIATQQQPLPPPTTRMADAPVPDRAATPQPEPSVRQQTEPVPPRSRQPRK